VLDIGGGRSGAEGASSVRSPGALARQLALHAARGFLVHVHVSGHTPKSWLIALAGALSQRPFGPRPLLTLHSGLVPGYLTVSQSRRALARFVARGYGRVVAVSPEIARALAAAGVPASRVTVAPAYIERIAPGAIPPAFDQARSSHSPLLASALSASPVYGARVLFSALPLLAAEMPRVGIALFGPARIQALRELGRKHRVEERLVLLGELAHPQATAVIAACDAFVRPALIDGDALSVREALALGRPVVASDVGRRPAGTVLFRSGDALDLARAVGRALGQPPSRQSPEGGLGALQAIYLELLGRPSRAPPPLVSAEIGANGEGEPSLRRGGGA
jgi:glycosyltransferase involved in cell wall biosynthesis